MRALLISTYELGHQPFGLASSAAWLRRAGAEVLCQDLSLQALDREAAAGAGLIGLYVPMHTATRLAAALLPELRALSPRAAIVCYGLYAPLNAAYLRAQGADAVIGGEFEAALVELYRRAAERAADDGRRTTDDGRPTTDDGRRTTDDWDGTADAGGGAADAGGGTRPAGSGTQHAGSGTRPAGSGTRPAGSGTQHAGSGTRPAGSGTRPAGSGTQHAASLRSAADGRPSIVLDRLDFIPPDRAGLPGPAAYAALDLGDGRRAAAGYTEASRGCKHTCRHCPIVPVYGGRFRVIPRDVVLEDVRRQVAAGARHITFGDPDFLNGPGHALPLVRALHAEFPGLTYDVTIKVEHLLRHARALPELRETGCILVTSAVEALDDGILARLDKNHTRADVARAAELLRAAGIGLNATFVAFTPWTTRAVYREFLAGVAELGLVESVAPIQYAIRLLLPAGSLLLGLEDVRALAGPFDPAALAHPWAHPDPAMDALQRAAQRLAQGSGPRGETRAQFYRRLLDLADEQLGPAPRPPLEQTLPRPPIPFLTEPWYC